MYRRYVLNLLPPCWFWQPITMMVWTPYRRDGLDIMKCRLRDYLDTLGDCLDTLPPPVLTRYPNIAFDNLPP